MILPCEIMNKFILPAIRAYIAKELKKQGFNQKSVANILGVTQPVISKYLSSKYDNRIKKLIKNQKIKEVSNEIVKMVIKGADKSEINKIIIKMSARLAKDFELR